MFRKMKKPGLAGFVLMGLFINATRVFGRTGDRWYENPLGFEPVKLHSGMGFLLPAAAVGACLMFTSREARSGSAISIYNESGFSWGYKEPHTFLAQNDSGVNIHLRRWMSIGAELDAYFPRDRFNRTFGLAIRLFARFYPVNTDRWKLYFESGGGIVCFLDRFPKPTPDDPRLGTRINGTTKYGLGSQIRFSRKTSVLFGVRHVHISNANARGIERNPSHDSNGLYLGFSHVIGSE